MQDRNMSPAADGIEQESSAHHRQEDDIGLPPMPAAESGGSDRSNPPFASSGTTRRSKLIQSALVCLIVVGSWFAMRGGSHEKRHENWRHVEAAAKLSTGNGQQVVHIDSGGTSETVGSIEVTGADAERSRTREVRAALRRKDLPTAIALLQSGQGIPADTENSNASPPDLIAGSELTKDLEEGRTELYQIELFDCCHEDGDVVEVLVNGSSFATVPIMHQGTMLSIPLTSGHNNVTIRGVKDGGGGVTLSLRTSRGEYFARYMAVGEEIHLGVLVR